MLSKIKLKLFFEQIKKNKLNISDKKNKTNLLINNVLNSAESKKKLNLNKNCPIIYIITIKYTRINTLLSVSNSQGLLQFYSSAGQFLKGKKKRSRIVIIKKFLKLLISNSEFLKKKPIALHLKNVDFKKFWLIKLIKKKFFIKSIKHFTIFPHNGCRKKKEKRKKIRSSAKKRRLVIKKKKRRGGRVA